MPTLSSRAAHRRVLIAGASFAGLSSAYWLIRLGYAVTIVEANATLKKGGTPVNIEGGTIGVVQRMGLLERIRSASLPRRPVQFVDARGGRVGLMAAQAQDLRAAPPEYEIERDVLLEMQYADVRNDAEFLFGDRIARIEESSDDVKVTFRTGKQQAFHLVLGCDGNHSSVRRMCFGEERDFSVFLNLYFSISIVQKSLLPENTTQIFNVPGKTVMLSAYNGKTDVCFCFYSENELSYDYRNGASQRALIQAAFESEEWRSRELVREMQACENFYFDKLCQIKMASWTAGRVALVGDAAYCASPAAGMGGSLAIVGACALADALRNHPNDFEFAFREYEDRLRPFIDKVQSDAVEFGLEMFAPRSEDAILMRNARFSSD